jgi:indole-3-glycerol phosphate synthase
MFLDAIVEHVREEVLRRRRTVLPSALRERPLFGLPRASLLEKLQGSSRHIIAEIKRASPSRGVIRPQFDPPVLAREFAGNGAAALSVLTEERFFQGSLFYLEQVKREVTVPVLRKDFIVDGYQLLEARGFGADAVLLIAGILERAQLQELWDEAQSLRLEALVEVHNEAELEKAVETGARVLGINNRDLHTFKVDLKTTEKLLPRVPDGIVVVCESGIDSVAQIQRLEQLGAHNFLVGESLMRAPDPAAKLREFLS